MKYSNPFKSGSIYLSQTYHSNSSNTAIDIGGKSAGTPVYAIADGVITVATSSGNGYCVLDVDNSNHRVFYVHTYMWKPVGTKVKQGDEICRIAPESANGGYAVHLHLGLQKGLNIMDYFDRDLVFKTNYSDIKAEWFNTNGLNWSLFKDLSYTNNDMKTGDRVEITADTWMRKGSGLEYEDSKYLVKEGAVGEIVGGPRNADDYEWWDINFEKCPNVSKFNQGWMANVNSNRFKVTSKIKTCVDGSGVPVEPEEPTDPCDEWIEENAKLRKSLSDAIAENDVLRTSNEDLRRLNENLMKYKDFYEGLAGYINLKNP